MPSVERASSRRSTATVSRTAVDAACAPSPSGRGVELSDGDGTPDLVDRARRRRDDAAGARALPRHRHPGARRQLRPRRLPDGDRRPTTSRTGIAACRSPASIRTIELSTLDVQVGETTQGRGQRRRRRRQHARPDDRARLRGRRRGAREPAVRRADLRDADGLDRLQPLERRAGARLGPRGDGADVRRAARARDPAARRAARHRRRGSRTRRADVETTVLVDGQQIGDARDRRGGRRSGSASSRACSRRCPRSTLLPRYAATFGRLIPTGGLPTMGGCSARLRITNLVLIREAELELAPGLNAITGETARARRSSRTRSGSCSAPRATRR